MSLAGYWENGFKVTNAKLSRLREKTCKGSNKCVCIKCWTQEQKCTTS